MSGEWSFGKVFVLRHAGFPFDWLEALGLAQETLAAIDALLECERALVEAAARSSPRLGKRTAAALEAGCEVPVPREVVGEWGACHETWRAQRSRAEAAFRAEVVRLQRVLHALACEPGVQEAVFLSSPDVFENVWSRYVVSGPGRAGADGRRQDRLAYAYLQRLCAKNETTSFFGPMGYGEIAGDDDAIELLPATPPERRTHVAYWAVEALASVIATEPELWGHLPMRKNPLFVVDREARLARCDALGRSEPLTDSQLQLLDALGHADHDGHGGKAATLAEVLGLDVPQVESVAMSLLVKGVLVRRLWYRSDRPDSLANLRAALAALPACEARERWLGNLDRLDTLRAEFAQAPLERRRPCLRTMESLFTQLARVPARRAGGRLYTDRLIVNEEASSPFRVRIGHAAAGRLSAALSPAFDLCATHGERLQAMAVRSVTDALATEPRTLGFLRYASLARGIPPPEVSPLEAERHPAHDRADGSSGARFALPDLCLARDADGSVRPVLSSMHHQLLTPGWLFTFHPDPSRVDELAAGFLDQPCTDPLVELATGRHNKGYYSFPGQRAAHAVAELERGDDLPAFSASECTVTIESGRPVLRIPDGRRARLYLPLADLSLHPPFLALSSPPVLLPQWAPLPARGEHTPRVDRSGATVQRARWTLDATLHRRLSGFDLFVAMRRVGRRHRLPRFVFATVPAERKPFLVDTECPFVVELLKHMARGSSAVTLEEMLPSPEQLWLRDGRGRYTFELRMQVQRAA